MAVQARLQLIHAGAAMGRDLQQRIIQLAVHVQEPVQRHLVVFVDQVGLVQQQQRRDARVLGGDEIAVDQVGVRLGERGEDNDDQVDIGRHGLELTAHVRPAQLRMPRQLRDDDADALVARAPDHAVAGDQCRQVGPQVAAEHLPAVFALQCLDLDLYAEMRDDQPGLFRAQVAALQLLEGTALATRGTGGALFLDLLDAPALPAVELAFGHGLGLSRSFGRRV